MFKAICILTDIYVVCNADVNEKRNLILQNIVNSLLVVGKRSKNDFNYEKLINDILSIVR